MGRWRYGGKNTGTSQTHVQGLAQPCLLSACCLDLLLPHFLPTGQPLCMGRGHGVPPDAQCGAHPVGEVHSAY